MDTKAYKAWKEQREAGAVAPAKQYKTKKDLTEVTLELGRRPGIDREVRTKTSLELIHLSKAQGAKGRKPYRVHRRNYKACPLFSEELKAQPLEIGPGKDKSYQHSPLSPVPADYRALKTTGLGKGEAAADFQARKRARKRGPRALEVVGLFIG